MINKKNKDNIMIKLNTLYGSDDANYIFSELKKKITILKENNSNAEKDTWVDEKDIFLITYGNSIISDSNSPMEILNKFADEYLQNHIKNIHILPFFPYSSDDGFSVIDYYKVNPDVGGWDDVEKLNKAFNLMFDCVINHISSQSEWFKEYKNGNEKYRNYFIEAEESDELKKVTRPRAKPLLNKFDTKYGEKLIWTTFSRDQIDLNFQNKEVLLEIIDIIFFYISKGAKFLRLDAIGYLWKKIGTSCIHLEETHMVIQLLRDILDAVAPESFIITETNVPFKDNISYFGDGYNEAQMVYQFPLPPLVLHAMHNQTGKYLSTWAKELELISNRTTFFNFLASHDGIGVMPVKGILPDEDIDRLVNTVKRNHGLVSYKNDADGKQSVYELNINYFDALIDVGDSDNSKIDKFVLAHSILLSIIGVPAIYIHSLIGSRNDYEGVKETGENRSINRESVDYVTVVNELKDQDTIRFNVYNKLVNLIDIRKNEKCFYPNAAMDVMDMDNELFAYSRTFGDEKIFVINNLSEKDLTFSLERYCNDCKLIDIISKKEFNSDSLTVKHHNRLWLKISSL